MTVLSHPSLPVSDLAVFDDLARLAAECAETPRALIAIANERASVAIGMYGAWPRETTDSDVFARLHPFANSGAHRTERDTVASQVIATADGRPLGWIVIPIAHAPTKAVEAGLRAVADAVSARLRVEDPACVGLPAPRETLPAIPAADWDCAAGFALLGFVADPRPDFRILFINAQGAQSMASTVAELTGLRLDQVEIGSPIPELAALYRRVLETGVAESLEYVAPEGHVARFEVWRIGEYLGVSFGDVTRAHKREVVRVRDRTRFAAVARGLYDLIWVVNPRGEVTDLPYHDELYGRNVDELRGDKWRDIVHPRDLPTFLRTARDAIARGAPFEVEARLRVDEEWRLFLHRAAPVCTSEGRVVEWVGVSHNIHLQRMLETELVQILDSIPALAWSSQSGGGHDYVNLRFLQYTGMDRKTLMSNGWRDLIHPEERAAALAAWDASVRDAAVYEFEYRLRGADGAYKWFLDRAIPIQNEDGAVTRWMGTSMEIDQLRTLQTTAERRERELEEIFDTMPQIVWRTSPNGFHDFFNARWYDYTGQTKEESMGEAWMEPLHPDDRERTALIWQRSLETGEDYEVEYRFREHTTGRYRWFLGRAKAIRDENGEIVRWFGTCTDIEAKKISEAELERRVNERTHALEMANRELEGFTHTVSHDLRAPLRSIVANARFLEEDYGDEIPAGAMILVKKQADAARKLSQLMDDLLQLARLGRVTLELSEVNVSEIAREEGDANVRVEDGLFVSADAKLLRLVVRNLLENARKFSGPDKTIVVGRNEDGEIFVRDDGIGFDMAYQQKLWKPFERLVRDDEFAGTGVGLANVKRIVELHGGSVRAESESGKGATFYLRFPPRRLNP